MMDKDGLVVRLGDWILDKEKELDIKDIFDVVFSNIKKIRRIYYGAKIDIFKLLIILYKLIFLIVIFIRLLFIYW